MRGVYNLGNALEGHHGTSGPPSSTACHCHSVLPQSYNIGVNQSSVKTSKTKSQINAISCEADYSKYLLYGWDTDEDKRWLSAKTPYG